MSNDPKIALVNTEESEGRLPVANTEEVEELPIVFVNGKLVQIWVLIKEISGFRIEFAPMNNLVRVISDNLRNYPFCRHTSRLESQMDRRVAFAANWKLSCMTCDAAN